MMMVETDGGKTLRHARYCDEAMDIEHTLYEWDGECYHSVTFVYTNPEIPLVAQETPPASQEAEMQESPLVQPEETVIAEFPAQEYTVGSEVYFGRYEHDDDLSNGPDPLPWQVIAVEDNRALLLTRDVIRFWGKEGYSYININQNDIGDGSSGINWAGRTNWENSELRYSLNTDFLDEAFLPEEQKAILTTLVKAEPHPLSDAGVVGNDTQDKIFILAYPGCGAQSSHVAQSATTAGLMRALDAARSAATSISYNVTPQLAIDAMFLEIREALCH